MAKVYTTMRQIKRKGVWGYYFYIGYKRKEKFVFKFTVEDLYLEYEEVIDILELMDRYEEVYEKLRQEFEEMEWNYVKGIEEFQLRLEAEFKTLKQKRFKEKPDVDRLMDLLIEYRANEVRHAYKNNEDILKMIDNIQYQM